MSFIWNGGSIFQTDVKKQIYQGRGITDIVGIVFEHNYSGVGIVISFSKSMFFKWHDISFVFLCVCVSWGKKY